MLYSETDMGFTGLPLLLFFMNGTSTFSRNTLKYKLIISKGPLQSINHKNTSFDPYISLSYNLPSISGYILHFLRNQKNCSPIYFLKIW